MITKFGYCAFAGHVDMEDLGLAGTPVNARFYSNEYLATVFDKTLAVSQLMDRSGYDTFWMAEHHFQPEGYECISNILMLSLHLAHLTEKIKLGCAFNISPMWHPLRLAEDFATVDILTGGRVIFGVGRGYHTREVETFGAPLLDREANRELFEEQVELIFKAFNEPSFSHHGKHYDIPPKVPYRGYELKEITLVPRPLRLPVECWQPIVSGSQRGMEFMARHGIKGIVAGGSPYEDIATMWRATQARHGRETQLGGDLNFAFNFFLGDTHKKAVKDVRIFYEEYMKMFGPLGFVPGLGEDQFEVLADPKRAPHAGLPTIEDGVKAGYWLCGPPEMIVERLQEIEEKYPGLEQVLIGDVAGTSQKVMEEQLQWFAEGVMPAFKDRQRPPS